MFNRGFSANTASDILDQSPPVYETESYRVSTGSSISVPRPANAEEGDLLIAFVYSNYASSVLTVPSGWTQIMYESGVAYSISGCIGVYYRYVSSDEDASYTFSTSTSRIRGMITRISSCNSIIPFDSYSVIGSKNAGSSIPTPDLSSSVENGLHIICVIHDGTAYISYSAPSGWTKEVGTSGPEPTMVATKTLTESGDVNAGNSGVSTSASYHIVAIIVNPV